MVNFSENFMLFFQKFCFFLFLLAQPLSLFAQDYADLPRFNMHYGVTPISRDIYHLHMAIFWICVVIGIIVFGAMTYAIIYHRKSKGAKAAQFHENTKLEMFWAIVPFIILIVMAIPATIVLIRMNNYDQSVVTVKITGYQWKWRYDYLDQGIGFFSNLLTPLEQINNLEPKSKWYLLEVDKPLILPVNEKIRFVLTSNDVIHSWWVPALGIKRDALPGFINEAWAKIEKPGIYRGQCAELCGINHGFMPIVVKAVTRETFNQWVQEEKAKQAESSVSPAPAPAQAQPAASGLSTQAPSSNKTSEPASAPSANESLDAPELLKLGKAAYNKYCAVCHQENGMGLPPTYPALRADSVVVGKPISRHIEIVLQGIPGSAMQGFADQLTDVELAAIITYERNAWDNNTGDVVQPQDIRKVKAQLKKQGITEINP